jgi:hypothetical protein
MEAGSSPGEERIMLRRVVLSFGLSVICVAPAASQFPFPLGGSGGGGGGRGFSAMLANPDFIFNFLSKGKDTIDRRELDPQFRAMADRFFAMANLNGDIITRDQFKTALQQVMQQFAGGGGAGMMGMLGGGGGTSGGAPGGGFGMGGFGRGERGGFNPDMIAERIFQRYDADGDGLLKIEEMPESLAIERDKWDTNNDGFIDLREYKEFFTARRQQIEAERAGGMGANSNSGGGESNQEPDVRRPVVYRANNLPRELPSWFAQADANQDAQVSLLEWRGTNMPIDQFKSMDRNGDNLLTVEEVLIYQKLNKGANMVASTGGGGFPGGGFPGGGFLGGSGGFGGFGGGRGGDRGQGGGFPGANFGGVPNSGSGSPTGDRGNFGGDRGGRGGGRNGFPGSENFQRGGRNRGG